MSNRELRTLSVPEGVAGERIDSALTRVLGLSRTAVVKLLEDGDITTGGKAMPKSDRVTAGQVIDVLMPAPVSSKSGMDWTNSCWSIDGSWLLGLYFWSSRAPRNCS